MAKVKHGTVELTLPDHLELPERAGKLTEAEVKKLPKARHGVGLACADSANGLRKVGGQLALPGGVTAEKLIEAGRKAEEMDEVITDAEVILTRAKQANLLFDAEAHDLLLQLNDAVNAAEKRSPELATVFSALKAYFANKRVKAGPVE